METVIQKITDAVRAYFQNYLAPLVNRVTKGKLTPDMVTFISLSMHVPIAFLIAMTYNLWAAVLLIVFGLLDALDGSLARVQGRISAHGMLLDSVSDRMKEILLYVGAAYGIVSTTGRPYLAVWAVAACGCSLLTSYINAWGDVILTRHKVANHTMNKSFRGGLFQFQVRMVIFVFGLLSNRMALAMIIITLGTIYTALSRLAVVYNRLNTGTKDVQN
jgi:phosphatidylglycerophosphate synthase